MKTTVLIPAYNEEKTIAKVVSDFRKELPNSRVIVYNNNSDDNTEEYAKAAGAEVRFCKKKGKGNVVQKMFDEIDSDIYIMADADDTYPTEEVEKLIKPVVEGEADMVVGSRMEKAQKGALTGLHKFGNKVIRKAVNFCFRSNIRDMLSGYRVMNRDLVKELVLVSEGFTIETEMTIKTLEHGFKIKEIPIRYRARPKGSVSKLTSFKDGQNIIHTILNLFRDYRPMQFFLLLSFACLVIAGVFGASLLSDFFQTYTVVRVPALVITVLFILTSMQLFVAGFIASSIHHHKKETLHMLNKIKKKKENE